MKVYTGSGDRGKTSLFSGERIAKNDLRIDAYGDVDELNSILGGLIAGLPKALTSLTLELTRIQSDLLDVGAWLATTPGSSAEEMLTPFRPEKVAWLEAAIDRLDENLPPLKGFILPGGHPSGAQAHVARTVCRRAERHALKVADSPGRGRSWYSSPTSTACRTICLCWPAIATMRPARPKPSGKLPV